MKRRNWWIGRNWAALSILGMAGCQSMFGPHGLPQDPLFLYQSPVEGQSTSVVPIRVTALEPAPPPLPMEMTNRPAYARQPASELPDQVQLTGFREVVTPRPASPRPVPGILTNRPLPIVPVLPDDRRP